MPDLAVKLSSLIGEGAERLLAAGIPEARREALRIWSELNGVESHQVLLAGQRAVEPDRASRFRDAVGRRSAGEPLCHVTGWVGFRYLVLRSDRRALIPRPETEGLVELLLQRVRTGVVADVGTGSGCIALSLASEGAFDRIVAVDCSADALELARLNGRLVDAPTAPNWVRADLTTSILPESLDALIANPPYLSLEEYQDLQPSVRRWEPGLALSGGIDGLESTDRLLDEGWRTLKPRGWLALEVDSTRAEAVARLAGRLGWQDVTVHLDLFGRERYLLARRSETR